MSIDIVIEVTLHATGPSIDRQTLVDNIAIAIERQMLNVGLSGDDDFDCIKSFNVEVLS